jgi:DNA-binding MarR family transcriptional regulator
MNRMVFDPLIANPGRLRILTELVWRERQAFVQLRAATGLTDGNLITHARRLRDAGLVTIHKELDNGKPLTTLALTFQGREALVAHAKSQLSALERRPGAVQPLPGDHDDDWVD